MRDSPHDLARSFACEPPALVQRRCARRSRDARVALNLSAGSAAEAIAPALGAAGSRSYASSATRFPSRSLATRRGPCRAHGRPTRTRTSVAQRASRSWRSIPMPMPIPVPMPMPMPMPTRRTTSLGHSHASLVQRRCGRRRRDARVAEPLRVLGSGSDRACTRSAGKRARRAVRRS